MDSGQGHPLRLTKHHGAGNDFLVLLDPGDSRPLTGAEVRALCHRRLGVGADGVLRGTPGRDGADLRMELRNADGAPAEMSGNGIRCLVQAAVLAGWIGDGPGAGAHETVVVVDTGAGRRRVTYRAGTAPHLGHASVAMGRPQLGDELPVDALRVDGPADLRMGRAVDMGNPHLVLLVGGLVGDAVVRDTGARLERSVPGGANVEFVWEGPGPGELTMRVWERGVGETLACGTGTCAAVAATASWGVTGGRVVVHNPGGPLEVVLGDDGAELGGPTAFVAEVEVSEAVLARMLAEGDVAARSAAEQPGATPSVASQPERTVAANQ